MGVTGSGFAPGEAVAIGVGGTPALTVTAGPKGAFSGRDRSGHRPLRCHRPDGHRGHLGPDDHAVVDISNEWTSSGDGSLHTGYEPNDETWDLHIVGNHSTSS